MSDQTENREKIEDISKEKYVLWGGSIVRTTQGK
jgi:hypothetical protein